MLKMDTTKAKISWLLFPGIGEKLDPWFVTVQLKCILELVGASLAGICPSLLNLPSPVCSAGFLLYFCCLQAELTQVMSLESYSLGLPVCTSLYKCFSGCMVLSMTSIQIMPFKIAGVPFLNV